MKRQITIYESAQNGKVTVLNDVECNTLAELKALLREKDINYTNMEFVEGVTNTKLLADDSRIPDNIPYKGKITNNVFINLLKKESKISSGVDYAELSRSELLRIAKPYAANIEAQFGRNYTQVKTADIISFLEEETDDSFEEYEDSPCEEGDYEEVPVVEAIVTMIKTIGVQNEVLKALQEEVNNKSFFSEEDMQSLIRG